MYIADTYNHRIRKITTSTGIITTIAGSTTSGSYSGDNGQATSAGLYAPIGIALDSSGIQACQQLFLTAIQSHTLCFYLGNVYIADFTNHRIRKVTVSTGIITTIAGTGSGTYSGDNGQATSAALYNPAGVVLDSSGSFYFAFLVNFLTSSFYLGNVYIGDQNNNRVRKVTVSTGIITTIAGSSTSGSYSGDNGQATSATLNYPVVVTLDSSGNSCRQYFVYIINLSLSNPLGNVYIADSYNHRVRKVTVSTGIITTFAGTGASSYSGDNGPATSASMYYPNGIALDSAGTHSLYYQSVRTYFSHFVYHPPAL